MVFNVLGCNRDDHTKNFAFLLGDDDRWMLAPAYDVTYAHNPGPGKWTATQQMSVVGKRENITRADLVTLGRNCDVATVPRLNEIIERVADALARWPEFAAEAEVGAANTAKIAAALSAQARISGTG